MNILEIKAWLVKVIVCAGLVLTAGVTGGLSQEYSLELKSKIDSLIVTAYQTAAEEFPCKIETEGSLRIMRWQDVNRCLDNAVNRVDWGDLAVQIEKLREEEGLLREDMTPIVESALSAHIVPYDRIFTVKKKKALLPLSNTVLKYAPENSLKDLPVFDKRQRKKIGVFFGSFTYEKSGGLSASNIYTLALFQYTDLKGDLQAPAVGDKLLLDAFGVPWEDARSKPGFRLTADKLGFKY